MQLPLVLIIVASLAAGEYLSPEPASDVALSLLLSLVLAASVAAAAFVIARRTQLRVEQAASEEQLERAIRGGESLQRLHAMFWLTTTAAILYALEWPAVVRDYLAPRSIVLLDELLLLTPALATLLLSWTAFATVARRRLAWPAALRQGILQMRARAAGELAPVLAPALAMALVCDVVRLGCPDLVARGGAWIIYLPAVLILALAFPLLLAVSWKTSPFPAGELRDALHAAATAGGVRLRRIRVWRTRYANAFVCGWGPLRTVYLSQPLLDLLDRGQLLAVFRHETAHLRLGHAATRMLAAVLPLLAFLAARRWLDLLGEIPPAAEVGLYAAAALLTAVYLACGFAAIARRLELDADRWAAQQTPDTAQQLISALDTLAAHSGEDSSRGGWLHPSLDTRVGWLEMYLQAKPRPVSQQSRTVVLVAAVVFLGLIVAPWRTAVSPLPEVSRQAQGEDRSADNGATRSMADSP
ncbi:M48 family metalloprotease [Lignipirellula cremea]|uniref:Heat shock protein HtpX n=1 Tax=Lignipirellula cremea TaxID=2528010 RepID=A0A518E2J5_9BACT|nr:M48 family metalloprotease [Lignipirellula cremea]QDU98315.1 heat shock protein HtpX [Lignipirellula cremea]